MSRLKVKNNQTKRRQQPARQSLDIIASFPTFETHHSETASKGSSTLFIQFCSLWPRSGWICKFWSLSLLMASLSSMDVYCSFNFSLSTPILDLSSPACRDDDPALWRWSPKLTIDVSMEVSVTQKFFPSFVYTTRHTQCLGRPLTQPIPVVSLCLPT